MSLTAQRLRELLDYDPATGVFTRRVAVNRMKAGDIAGSRNALGYLAINLDGRKYYAHRLAWMYVHGRLPSHHIDHINADRTDNRLVNLREASHAENLCNRGANANNTSGFKGVSLGRRGRWKARVNGRHLGTYDTPEGAHEAYRAKAAELHGDFARFD